MNKQYLTHWDVGVACQEMAKRISTRFPGGSVRVHPVPRGGVPVAYMLLNHLPTASVTMNPVEADVFVDDLLDSGATRDRYAKQYPGTHFEVAFNKDFMHDRPWLVFPWEHTEEKSIEDAFVRLLQFIGEEPSRGGLRETPARMAKAWRQWASGYGTDPASVLKVFEDGAERVDEMVVVRELPFYSHCEHHLAPFFGTATIGYIPNGKIVGLSKLSRLLDVFARRLQVQERLTNQVADAIEKHLEARGVGVVLKARHLCMESRGICQQGHHTLTSALRGAMRDQADTRAEFMSLTSHV